jgi:uncharacterized OB-fold protein
MKCRNIGTIIPHGGTIMAQRPIKKNLFHSPATQDDESYLIGSRCGVCGYASFPPKHVCIKCRREGTMNEVKLGPRGILDMFAVMQVGTPDFPAPYVIGFVRLEQGPMVFSVITGCEPKDDALTIGQEMMLVIDKIRTDENGLDVVGWKFKPLTKE